MVLTVGSVEFIMYLCYNINMDFGPKDTPFDGDIDIDSIEFTESLASRVSFENYLFDKRAQRRAVYTLDTPEDDSHDTSSKPQQITISAEQLQTTIPEELRPIFGNEKSVIEHLSVLQEETPDLAFFFMKFSLNGTPHSLTSQSTERFALYTTRNAYGDTVTYQFPKSTPQALLASILYIQQYLSLKSVGSAQRAAIEEAHGEGFFATPEMFSLEESNIQSDRIEDCDLIERMIMTLGHFDGVSQTITSSLIPTGKQILLAELSHTESASYTHASNDLDLSILTDTDQSATFDRLGLTQHLAEITAFTNLDFNDQVGEIGLANDRQVVSPQSNPKGWSRLCREFAVTMKKELEPYLVLDEAV